jgi:hypothetical protein
MSDERLLSTGQLEAGLDEIRRSPKDAGVLKLIVRRPREGQREVVDDGQLDVVQGLLGDNWKSRGSRHSSDGSADPDAQVTIMNARAASLVAGTLARWPLAGDQLYIDVDLSQDNLPPGTRLAIGSAVVEITAQPHTGCKLFAQRFGTDAVKFVNSPAGKQLRLRGLNAKVVQSGAVCVGDVVRKRTS